MVEANGAWGRTMRRLGATMAVVLASGALGAAELTPETDRLRAWLARENEGFALGGHWSAGSASVGWDVQAAISGRQPLLFSVEYYDVGPVERKPKERAQAAAYLLEKFRSGGICTLVDHMPNPVTRGDAWDIGGNALAAILPGGAEHAAYRAYLDRLAEFLSGLQVNGVKVPVLFRPFHEMNGNWFWWGGKSAATSGLVDLWRFTHDYLMVEKDVDNVLWVWSPNVSPYPSTAEFEAYWPGRNYVDVVGLDGYDNTPNPNFESASFTGSFQIVSNLAWRNRLPIAWSEIGFKPGGQAVPGVWNERVLPALKKQYRYVRYVLIWNADFGPRPGTPAAPGFAELSASPGVLRLGDAPGSDIYGPGYPATQTRPGRGDAVR